MKICVVGMGYVGIANALLLAEKHDVVGVDINTDRVDLLNSGKSPLNDKEIIEAAKLKKAKYTTQLDTRAELYIIATPTNYDDETGMFDTSSIESVLGQVKSINEKALVLIKSTIPVGYVERMRKTYGMKRIIFSPEFLREGSALKDNQHPSRIVIGDRGADGKKLSKMFAEAALSESPVLLTGPTEAEAIKLFANTYLALRVSYFNEVDTYCMWNKLNARDVVEGVGLDPRIGTHYNNPSFGYGGYCLPKDTKQLLANYADIPQKIISAIVEANSMRKELIADEVAKGKPKTVGIYRLAMKADSDNFRQSAVLDVIQLLQERGVSVIVYEPTAESYAGLKLVNDFDAFQKESNVIVANRMDDRLKKVKKSIFTRDIFGIN